MSTRISFTQTVYNFLRNNGYTHIQNIGCSESGEEKDEEISDYILVALKPGDPLLQSDDPNLWIENIESDEVLDMLSGEPGINFIIEIPESDFAKFEKEND